MPNFQTNHLSPLLRQVTLSMAQVINLCICQDPWHSIGICHRLLFRLRLRFLDFVSIGVCPSHPRTTPNPLEQPTPRCHQDSLAWPFPILWRSTRGNALTSDMEIPMSDCVSYLAENVHAPLHQHACDFPLSPIPPAGNTMLPMEANHRSDAATTSRVLPVTLWSNPVSLCLAKEHKQTVGHLGQKRSNETRCSNPWIVESCEVGISVTLLCAFFEKYIQYVSLAMYISALTRLFVASARCAFTLVSHRCKIASFWCQESLRQNKQRELFIAMFGVAPWNTGGDSSVGPCVQSCTVLVAWIDSTWQPGLISAPPISRSILGTPNSPYHVYIHQCLYLTI